MTDPWPLLAAFTVVATAVVVWKLRKETNVSEKLPDLIELARKHRMTDEEKDEQAKSFAYGNVHMHNESVAKADVERAAVELRKETK
jgi:hypothetical protein